MGAHLPGSGRPQKGQQSNPSSPTDESETKQSLSVNDGELNNYVNAQHIRHVKACEQFVLHSEGSTKAAKT